MAINITPAQARQMTAWELHQRHHQAAIASELARRVAQIHLAVNPVAAEYLMDHELGPKEVREILNEVIHILDGTKDVTL